MSIPFLTDGTVDRLGELDSRGWFAAFFAGVLAYALAYFLWYKGLEVLSPSQTAIYIYLVPVFGIISAWLFLGETITVWLVIGGATILAGVIVTNTARSRRKPVNSAPSQSFAAPRAEEPLATIESR